MTTQTMFTQKFIKTLKLLPGDFGTDTRRTNTFINRPNLRSYWPVFIIPWQRTGWYTRVKKFVLDGRIYYALRSVFISAFSRKNHANNISWDISCRDMEKQQCFFANLYRCQLLRFAREQTSAQRTEISLVGCFI